MAKERPNSAPETAAPPTPEPAEPEVTDVERTPAERAKAVEAATISLQELKELPAEKRLAVSEASAYVRGHLPNPIVEPGSEQA